MTANVAQVFLTDEDVGPRRCRAACRSRLRPGGWLVFETRDPARRAWEQWTPALTHTVVDIPGMRSGRVVGRGPRRCPAIS